MAAEPITVAVLEKSRAEDVRVSLSTYAGRQLLDLRIFADWDGRGVRCTSKKGLSLGVDRLPQLIAALEDARDKAAELGWLEDGE